MISGLFAVVFLQMHNIIVCFILLVFLPEVHDKMTKIDGLILQLPFFELDQPWQIECGTASNCHTVSSVACQLVKSF